MMVDTVKFDLHGELQRWPWPNRRKLDAQQSQEIKVVTIESSISLSDSREEQQLAMETNEMIAGAIPIRSTTKHGTQIQ